MYASYGLCTCPEHRVCTYVIMQMYLGAPICGYNGTVFMTWQRETPLLDGAQPPCENFFFTKAIPNRYDKVLRKRCSGPIKAVTVISYEVLFL